MGMNLRTKLFLAIGALLVFLSLIMYFMPYFLVEEDVGRAADELKQIVHNEEVELAKSQKTLLERQLDEIEANIDALLYLIYDSPELSKTLSLEKSNKQQVWKTLSRFLAYDPSIGFLQFTDLNSKQSFGIISNQVPLYHYASQLIVPNCYLVTVDQNTFFVGLDVVSKGKSLLLFTLEDFWNFEGKQSSNPVVIALNKAKQNILKKWHAQITSFEDFKHQLFAFNQSKTSEVTEKVLAAGMSPNPYFKRELLQRTEWASSVQMIQILAPYFGESLENDSYPIPTGIAQIDILGRPLSILSKDVFRIGPLFDDVSYYNNNSVQNDPIANQRALIQDPQSHTFYLANTMSLGQETRQQTLITIGTHLYSFVRGLALSSDRWVVLMVNQQIDLGFTEEGLELSEKDLKLFAQQLQKGNVDVNRFPFLGRSYRVFQISLEPKWHLTFFLLTPKEKERMLEETLIKLNQAVSARISYHILLVALGSLILALFILSRISLNVTRPIAKLAEATQQVASGKYDEIVLPSVNNRTDEVAILTLSFKEMVKGLVEREKIRGVLNKVVSKDVANEILKSNIHLGGEDRIVTMLFSDIRGFTDITENLSPQNVIQMLNTYMTRMSRIIEREGGCIDKYVGDEIMALYGAPVYHPDHAVRAISSAILMIEALKKWNRERIQNNQAPIEMGIGIHTGLVVAGNMGAEDRLNYTVLGSSVNLASRLCSIARPMQILISESTFNEEDVKQYFKYETLLPINLKGFSESIKVFQINGFEWS